MMSGEAMDQNSWCNTLDDLYEVVNKITAEHQPAMRNISGKEGKIAHTSGYCGHASFKIRQQQDPAMVPCCEPAENILAEDHQPNIDNNTTYSLGEKNMQCAELRDF
jgi:hypothetical protein